MRISASGRVAVALCAAVVFAACGDSNSPSSPSVEASVVGSVMSDQTAAPVPDATVDFERCNCGSAMMSSGWSRMQSMMTDAQGEFRFEYMHDSEHHYRVRVRGVNDPNGMCYLDDAGSQPVVLHVP